MAKPKYTVIVQEWEESERGWGTRPDGVTLHVNRRDHAAFVKEYHATHNNLDYVPDEYTRTAGDPFEAEVPKKLAMEVAKSGNGIWLSGANTWEAYKRSKK